MKLVSYMQIILIQWSVNGSDGDVLSVRSSAISNPDAPLPVHLEEPLSRIWGLTMTDDILVMSLP